MRMRGFSNPPATSGMDVARHDVAGAAGQDKLDAPIFLWLLRIADGQYDALSDQYQIVTSLLDHLDDRGRAV